ncbi:hypothetical protein PR048_009120 [Dryococelus australis]|uniref:Uncharacterized protein n=1 Tax=Dryococelus australis TaxID=614101 RepID=A0ABQ9HZ10_9NEOP|nr:hypothetical protein PR048_009120 [Dryococelus australis]
MSSFDHIPCLAHTLQLVLKEGLLGSKLVTNLLSQCRRLVGHFKHSAHATEIFKKYQMTTGMPMHQLIKMSQEGGIEQKRAILLYGGELDLPGLNGQQWTLIDNLI